MESLSDGTSKAFEDIYLSFMVAAVIARGSCVGASHAGSKASVCKRSVGIVGLEQLEKPYH